MAGGGDNKITIEIDVNNSKVKGGISEVTAQLNNFINASRYASQATSTLGGFAAQHNVAWLQSATSVQDYTQRLAMLTAMLNITKMQQGENTDALTQFTQSWGNMVVYWNQGLQLLGMITGGFETLISPIVNASEAVVSFAESLGQIAWDGIQQGIDLLNQLSGALDAVTSTMQTAFAESAFQLNETTEKNFANWMFLWGGPNRGGGNIAQQLVQWTKQASLVMPYTRQDLMAAVTTLSAMPNQTPGGIEKDLQLLSDVASTQGRPGLTLQWAAMAAMRGSQGYSRMLLMDLNISKTQLAQFGYNEKDDTTFFPALEKYEKWKGEYGASATISTQTFWGAQTSFTDRIQNFLLSAGGWNNNANSIMGDVRKGSLFGGLKDDLIGISHWMDTNGPTLDKLASVADALFGGAVRGAGSIFSGLFDNLSKTNLASDFFTGVSSFGTWLNSPETQHNLSEFGNLIGNIVGPGLRDMGTSAENFWRAFTGSGIGQDIIGMFRSLGDWLASPDTQAGFKNLGTLFGQIGGGGLQGALDSIKGLLSGLGASAGGGFANSVLGQFANWISNRQTLLQIQAAAYAIGVTLGDAFAILGVSAEYALQGIKDVGTLLYDLTSGNYAQFLTDLQQMQTDMAQSANDFQNMLVQVGASIGKSQSQLAGDVFGLGPGSPPDHTGKGTAGKNIAAAIAAALHPHQQQHATAGHLAGQVFAQSYIAAAQQTFQQQNTSGQLVQTLANGIQQELNRGGNTLVSTLAQFIDQRTRQMIADMLAGYDLTSNRVGRQVGGFRNGPALGF